MAVKKGRYGPFFMPAIRPGNAKPSVSLGNRDVAVGICRDDETARVALDPPCLGTCCGCLDHMAAGEPCAADRGGEFSLIGLRCQSNDGSRRDAHENEMPREAE